MLLVSKPIGSNHGLELGVLTTPYACSLLRTAHDASRG